MDTACGIHAQISKKLKTPFKNFFILIDNDIMFVDFECHR